MLNLCITCDHEIYFGDNYLSEDEVVIKPTNRLCEVLDKYSVKATFFTDVCSIFRYKELHMMEYPHAMENQLQGLINSGHDVQLHVHPHWYNSDYINGCWQFDKNSYRIHTFGFDNTNLINANTIIREGKNYLLNLLTSINSDYRCIAYRAGGLCLQPEKDLIEALRTNGIHIDSSIIKGVFANTDAQYYSYLQVPQILNWWIDPNTGISIEAREDYQQNIFEVPIGSLSSPVRSRLLARKNKRSFIISEPSRGGYMPISFIALKPDNRIERFFHKVNSTLTFSFDSYCAEVLLRILDEYLGKNDCYRNELFLSIICHPKILRNEHLKQIDLFIRSVINKYNQVRFVTMQDVDQFISDKK
ncbi:hypothetical protein [Dehalobacter sp.]|uniref:hypothetical protein n=1 Tax=Dehalobacter sp. TaxID=1962289 RepID=UPI002584C6FB|nr:hypothetical protein [Dehalobacter sp.]MDJ0304950.1 hypothetical protein [Dehalobacter sp.]